ncbi:hypothetical protein EDC04DRAFT_1023496 [Pisolithus marmoratus]|nr:hypothetical protein EDC04DRAFT_1023496 [Pisolithus marmoratus]
MGADNRPVTGSVAGTAGVTRALRHLGQLRADGAHNLSEWYGSVRAGSAEACMAGLGRGLKARTKVRGDEQTSRLDLSISYVVATHLYVLSYFVFIVLGRLPPFYPLYIFVPSLGIFCHICCAPSYGRHYISIFVF